MRSSSIRRAGRFGAAAGLFVTVTALAACSTPAAGPSYGGAASGGAASGGGAPPSSAAASSSPAGGSDATPGGADLTVASTALGKVVVDARGRTVYYFDHDKAGSGASSCAGECLAAWPAVAPAGSTPTVEGVTAKVATITRDDGTKQLTLDGRPVYEFVKDTAPGDVKGQGVGGVWYVVAADGTEVRGAAR